MHHVATPMLRGSAQLEARHEEEGPREVVIRVAREPDHTSASVRISGAGPGGHHANFRFDRGDGHFNETRVASWDGDHHLIDIPYVPTGAIVVIDGSPEIRL